MANILVGMSLPSLPRLSWWSLAGRSSLPGYKLHAGLVNNYTGPHLALMSLMWRLSPPVICHLQE